MKKVCLFIVSFMLMCGLLVTGLSESATLVAGSYTVGEDLPEGEYEITCIKISNFYTEYMDSMQSLAGEDSELGALFSLYNGLTSTMEATIKLKGSLGENKGSFSLKENGTKKISLENGWRVEIDEGTFEFTLLKSNETTNTEDTVKQTSSETVDQTRIVKERLSLDFSEYSDDEMINILKLVNQEIVNRKLNKVAKIPGGSYVAGEDIPVGKYILETIDDSWGTSVKIYTDSTKDLKLDSAYINDGRSYIFSLEEGNLFYVDRDVVLNVYTGITFN